MKVLDRLFVGSMLVGATALGQAHFLYVQPSVKPGSAIAVFAETGLDTSLALVAERQSEIRWRNLGAPATDKTAVGLSVTDSTKPFGADWDYGVLDKKAEGRYAFGRVELDMDKDRLDLIDPPSNQVNCKPVGGTTSPRL